MEISNVQLGFDFEAVKNIVRVVEENIDIDSLIESKLEDFDFSSPVESWIDDNLDDRIETWIDYNLDVTEAVDTAIGNIDFSDHIDYSEIANKLDIENEAYSLLVNYSPINGCGTGQEFTSAIAKAIRYLMIKNEDVVESIVKATNKFNLKQVIEEEKQKAIEEAKPGIIEDFKKELNQYVYDTHVSLTSEKNVQTTPNFWNRSTDQVNQ
jgi:hypothetical protein